MQSIIKPQKLSSLLSSDSEEFKKSNSTAPLDSIKALLKGFWTFKNKDRPFQNWIKCPELIASKIFIIWSFAPSLSKIKINKIIVLPQRRRNEFFIFVKSWESKKEEDFGSYCKKGFEDEPTLDSI